MSEPRDHLAESLAELRAEFDGAFALAPPLAPEVEPALLLLRLGGRQAAVRVSEIKGLLPCQGVVPVPSRAPGLLGIAGVRGELVPVFSLARLSGHPGELDPPRWMLLCGEEPLGLAFALLEAQIRVPAAAIEAIEEPPPGSLQLSQLVKVGEVVVPLLSIPALLAGLASPKESHR